MSIEGISNHSVAVNSNYVNDVQNAQKDQLETIEPKLEEFNQVVSKEKLEEVIHGLNNFLIPTTNTALKFELHEELNTYYVKVIDENSKEIIREIPSKKLLDIYASMTEFLGLAVDKKV
ncbi:flagellar protein FlaG [Metabacillus litoralis]|uniref:Flagellar protein FlaG n=1 Tax=Metabacillus litoralis TaxID=152268 RepID=A0A5C6W007_9BACI|nr:flagellar protein FlaG [Metabacillus litoralis]TXC90983.1 flagellar protein FlaG [Metabacillus litoralis]